MITAGAPGDTASAAATSASMAAPPPPPPYPPPPSALTRPSSFHGRLYDFAKAVLIKIFVSPYATVCDLHCGPGADADKWDEAQIGHYIGIDEASSGISEARELWESALKPYTAEFVELDPSVENLESRLQEKGIPADVVCCLQNLQVSFESEEKARRLLQNVSAMLKPGGFFFGITPDSSTIWTKYQKIVEAAHNKGLKPNAVPNSIKTENYVITFEVEEEKFPFFGKKYQLKFHEDVSSETHCLVHIASLIRLAREAGLEVVEIQNLTDFYDDNRAQFAGILHSYGPYFLDPRGKLLVRAYDVLGLYVTFAFQKPDPDVAPPIWTPFRMRTEEDQMYEEDDWQDSWGHQQSSMEEDVNSHADIIHHDRPPNPEKGILGPGPADLRFPEPFKPVQYPDHRGD